MPRGLSINIMLINIICRHMSNLCRREEGWSDNDLALVVVVAEGRRGATLLLLEDAVEVADVVESALVAYLRHVDGAVHQEACSMP